MRIAIDFDDTITYPSIYPVTGNVNPKAITYIKKLKESGHVIILYTGRRGKDLEEAIDICRREGIEFDEIEEKMVADYYIDDRAIRPEEVF